MNRKRVALIVGVVLSVLGVVGMILWFVLHTRVLLRMWDRTAAQPFEEAELVDLARCTPPSWSTWLKVMRSDVDVICGEAWVASQLAERIGSADRAHWVAIQVGASSIPAGTRMRGGVALLLAGWGTPVEPAWLSEQLEPTRRAMWVRAAAESDPVSLQVGPALASLGAAGRVRIGTLLPADALPALDWLARVGDPYAEAEASLTATQAAGVYPELVGDVRVRRAAGRPVAGAAGRWNRELLAHPECEAPGDPSHCASLWTEILDRVLTEDSLETGVALPPEPEPHPRIAQILASMASGAQERRAAGHAIRAAVAWVAASPDPGARLRSLAARVTAPSPTITRFPWDGTAPPFLSAVVVSAIGDGAEVPTEIRVGDQGDLWIRIDGVDVLRACDLDGAPSVSDGAPWPPDAVMAGALAELAAISAAEGQGMSGLRLATAAERIDPLVAGPLAVRLAVGAPPELEAGRRIGVSLLRPVSPPTGAEASRRRAGEHGPTTCRTVAAPIPAEPAGSPVVPAGEPPAGAGDPVPAVPAAPSAP